LAVDLNSRRNATYESSVKFFGIVSSMIAQALNVQRLVEESGAARSTRTRTCGRSCASATTFSNIIGTSGPTRQMYEQVAQVAQTNTTVLIRGESGTGKELIATRSTTTRCARRSRSSK
jgi:Nif-specific regulatory protein